MNSVKSIILRNLERDLRHRERDTSFFALLTEAGLLRPVTEHRFHPTRKWRFDYAWPSAKVALEVEGGVWTGGRHTRGAGFLKDIEKYNQAGVKRWIVLKTTPSKLATMDTINLLKEIFDV